MRIHKVKLVLTNIQTIKVISQFFKNDMKKANDYYYNTVLALTGQVTKSEDIDSLRIIIALSNIGAITYETL